MPSWHISVLYRAKFDLITNKIANAKRLYRALGLSGLFMDLFRAPSLPHRRCLSLTLHRSDSLSCGGLQSLALHRPAAPAAEQQSELGAELLVAQAVDEGAEEARQDVGEEEGGEEDVPEVGGEGPDQVHGEDGRGVGQHADQQLDSMEQDGVPRLPGRHLHGPGALSLALNLYVTLDLNHDLNVNPKGKPAGSAIFQYSISFLQKSDKKPLTTLVLPGPMGNANPGPMN